MKSMPIVQIGAAVLRRPTILVTNITGSTARLVKSMALSQVQAGGLGLAANQLGYSKSIFTYVDENGSIREAINPVLVDQSKLVTLKEGCLSIPGRAFMVQRPTQIVIQALDLDGNERLIEARDRLAQCFAHELDHLAGRLIADSP